MGVFIHQFCPSNCNSQKVSHALSHNSSRQHASPQCGIDVETEARDFVNFPSIWLTRNQETNPKKKGNLSRRWFLLNFSSVNDKTFVFSSRTWNSLRMNQLDCWDHIKAMFFFFFFFGRLHSKCRPSIHGRHESGTVRNFPIRAQKVLFKKCSIEWSCPAAFRPYPSR